MITHNLTLTFLCVMGHIIIVDNNEHNNSIRKNESKTSFEDIYRDIKKLSSDYRQQNIDSNSQFNGFGRKFTLEKRDAIWFDK